MYICSDIHKNVKVFSDCWTNDVPRLEIGSVVTESRNCWSGKAPLEIIQFNPSAQSWAW